MITLDQGLLPAVVSQNYRLNPDRNPGDRSSPIFRDRISASVRESGRHEPLTDARSAAYKVLDDVYRHPQGFPFGRWSPH